MNIIAGISISILATAITGIIVGTTTGFQKYENIDKPLLLGPNDSSALLPGRLFSQRDMSKNLSHHYLLHFLIGMGMTITQNIRVINSKGGREVYYWSLGNTP